MSDNSIIKTYVWHGDRCFFVSTIERDSSAAAYQHRYNETMVWDYDWKTGKRGDILFQGEAGKASIRTHQKFVQELFETGEVNQEEP